MLLHGNSRVMESVCVCVDNHGRNGAEAYTPHIYKVGQERNLIFPPCAEVGGAVSEGSVIECLLQPHRGKMLTLLTKL